MEKTKLVRTFGAALATATLSFGLFAAPAIADPSISVKDEVLAVVVNGKITYKDYDASDANNQIQVSAKFRDSDFDDFDANKGITVSVVAKNESLKVEQEFAGTPKFYKNNKELGDDLRAAKKADEIFVRFAPGADALNGDWTVTEIKIAGFDSDGNDIDCKAEVSLDFTVKNGKKEINKFPQLREQTVSVSPDKVNAKINQRAILNFDVYVPGVESIEGKQMTAEVVYADPAGEEKTITLYNADITATTPLEGTDSNGWIVSFSTAKKLPNDVDGIYSLKSIKLIATVDDLKTSKTYTSGLWDGDYEVVSSGVAAVYRAYNSYDGQHLYTTGLDEYLQAVIAGWTPEGLAWYAPTNELSGKTLAPVYRVYNQYNGEHHFTVAKDEVAALLLVGWNDEDVAFYTAQPEGNGNVPVYRLFNPYAEVGTHHYTTDKGEYDKLVKAGWTGEGIGWYAVKA